MSPTASAAAFDAVATRYDAITASDANPVIAAQRLRVHAAFARHFAAGSRLLEVGCGTGEDTLALTARGHTLVACDPAPAMLTEAARKLAAAGRAHMARFVPGGTADLAASWPSLAAAVDGVFSNFAPLNCELSLAPLRALLDQALPPGGRFVAVVLPRWSPLEIACFLAAGRPRTALRRFGPAPVADVEGHTFPIRYYGPADFDRRARPRLSPRRDPQPRPAPPPTPLRRRRHSASRACGDSSSRPKIASAPCPAYATSATTCWSPTNARDSPRRAARPPRASAAPDPGACRRARASPWPAAWPPPAAAPRPARDRA